MGCQKVDLTRLFSVIDSIVCAFAECLGQEGSQYFISVGYIADKIVLKLDDTGTTSLCRYELKSPRLAMQTMERIIEERGLTVKIITFYFDSTRANLTTYFYTNNEVAYTFMARSRSYAPITFSYSLNLPDSQIDNQELSDNYKSFLVLISQNERGLSIVEASDNPNKRLRKSKLQDLLAD